MEAAIASTWYGARPISAAGNNLLLVESNSYSMPQEDYQRNRMPIPDFQTLMLPLLQLAADGQEYPVRDARETLADQFTLSPEER